MLECSQCGEPFVGSELNRDEFASCRRCGKLQLAYVFPAYWDAKVVGETGTTRLGHEASCFFHPDKQAQCACNGCGRFLCALCDIELAGKHLCTTCIQRGDKAELAALNNEAILHDSVTLTLAVALPFFMWPLLPISAPYVIYRVVRHWNKPTSIVRTSKWRLVVAFGIAILELAGLGLFVLLMGSR